MSNLGAEGCEGSGLTLYNAAAMGTWRGASVQAHRITPLGVNCTVNCMLGVIMIPRCRFINCNKSSTPVRC